MSNLPALKSRMESTWFSFVRKITKLLRSFDFTPLGDSWRALLGSWARRKVYFLSERFFTSIMNWKEDDEPWFNVFHLRHSPLLYYISLTASVTTICYARVAFPAQSTRYYVRSMKQQRHACSFCNILHAPLNLLCIQMYLLNRLVAILIVHILRN